MDTSGYFGRLKTDFDAAYSVATGARERGLDPERFVEIKPAPDLASRVEGIIGIEGLTGMIKGKMEGRGRKELAFDMVKEICTGSAFSGKDVEERLTIAVRVGLAILTDAVVVAATEGLQAVVLHKSADGSDYIAIVYAGPIRGAGGTGAAMSVALADYGRKLLGIGAYRAQQSEVERCIEEMQLYHARIARLQYYPPESDMRVILENLSVCVDGMPTERIEINIHRNIKRLDKSGKEEMITNKVRGGIGLVICEGIAQKAKSVLKYTKAFDLDWNWLNSIIRFDKSPAKEDPKEKSKTSAVFLQELVAGRPVIAYPNRNGGFRLRYGRSRITGIAAKGFNPATMIILDDFIVCGTQLRVEKPGKGCVAAPVDSIEGPFVKLDTGEALRISDAETARALKGRVTKIISVGDILVTYGDFKKSNTPLQPTSYVEEYWTEQLKASGADAPGKTGFRSAYELSQRHGVPMHPQYIYDYSDISTQELGILSECVSMSEVEGAQEGLFGVKRITFPKAHGDDSIVEVMERLCIPHAEGERSITVDGEHAQSLLASLGFSKDGALDMSKTHEYDESKTSLENVNSVAPFKVMRRATRIGGRIGRPEKAKERLMKPSPHVLFPVGESGGKERSITKVYSNEKNKFGNRGISVEVAKYRCRSGREVLSQPYCSKHGSFARLERTCASCGRVTEKRVCPNCGGNAYAKEQRSIHIMELIESAMSGLGVNSLSKSFKGVKLLMNRDKIPEPMEKGILRAMNNVHIFKDGTSRFDATDMPMTHFYPREVMVPVEKLRDMGYERDCYGKELTGEDQLVEMFPQDIVINRDGAQCMLNVAKFIDQLLVKFYKMEPFYNISSMEDLVGHYVITLSPHTSAGVLCRIAGFTDAHVGFAHPYVICARRRNCDGDEDTMMLLMDALINFSRSYLPVTIGGTMDAPLILTTKLDVSEIDDEVHEMEVVTSYGLDFYEKTNQYASPSEAEVCIVRDRLKESHEFSDIMFTHLSGIDAINGSPHKSIYTRLNSMKEKIEAQFRLIDMLYSVDKADSAKRLLLSHFIPDLIGNMHSFSRQSFRCVACNAKYRRVPLIGKCTRCNGKLVLTISKGSIEKYLTMAIDLADRYDLEPYIKQRLVLIKEEIRDVFGTDAEPNAPVKQFNLSRFM
ncbi:MAG: DNA polymerase II large subunit [Candidatus Micrarchaeota archaeon]|nr:DNA polymerase II large subunit [Candidatus Micrarchaeota archaeon]